MYDLIDNRLTHLGYDSINNILNDVLSLNSKKILIITDYTLNQLGITKKIVDILDKKVEYVIFDDIKTNPNIKNVKDATYIALENKVDLIIALGGGSAIDVAKCASIIVTNEEYKNVISLDGSINPKNNPIPVIAIPTTCGTGGEVSNFFVISDDENQKKIVGVCDKIVPFISIIDPSLAATLPKNILISTMFDGLSYALESYLSTKSCPLSDMYALNSISLIYKNMDNAINEDKDALEKVYLGVHLAGIGVSLSGFGLVHILSQSLEMKYDTFHGLSNAALLPHVINRIESKKYKDVISVMGINKEGNTKEILVNEIKEKLSKYSISSKLSELGANREDIQELADLALNCLYVKNGLVKVNKDDIINILYEAM